MTSNPGILGPTGQPVNSFARSASQGSQSPQGPSVPEGHVIEVVLSSYFDGELPRRLYPIGISAGPEGCGLADVFCLDSENKVKYFHQLQIYGVPYYVTFVLAPKWFQDAFSKFMGQEQKGG
jgi:hypothetical protein